MKHDILRNLFPQGFFRCATCALIKPLDQFSKDKREPYGYRTLCKSCGKIKTKKYLEKKRPENRLRPIKHIDEFGNVVIIAHMRLSEAKKKFGETCNICGGKEKLCVDHCHISHKIRGVLCRNCNLAIGLLKDKVEILEKAIKYLT